MQSGYPKFFEEFLKLQPAPVHPTPHNKNLIAPPRATRTNEPMTFDDIVRRKPKPKRVLKYLQGMIDEIIAENDA